MHLGRPEDMKLIDIIEYLSDPTKVGQLYDTLRLSTDSEAILIYMKNTIDLDSELKFFEIEHTEDQLVFEENGVTYYQLLPLDHAVEILDSYFSDKEKKLDNFGLAKRLLEYAINDA